MRIINNKKFIIAFLSVLLLSIVCFSGITMMFADEENGTNFEPVTTEIKAADDTANFTIIDHIIRNSHDTQSTDQVYHVLEISSGSTESALKDMVESANQGNFKVFEELVLNGHKSAAQTLDLNPGKIDYQFYSYNHSPEQDIIDAINRADFIYLSEDPNNLWDGNSNVDITNTVFDALNKFVFNDGKPFVVDSHKLTQQGSISNTKYVKDLVANYYAVEGTQYSTFAWPHALSVEDFMNPAANKAVYVPVNGDTKKDGIQTNPNFGWNKVTYTEILTSGASATSTNANEVKQHEEYIGRVLTIHNSALATDDNFLTNQLKACCDGNYSFTYTDVDHATPQNKTLEARGNFTPDGDILNLKEDSDLYKFGYLGRLARPTALKFESLDMSNAADLTTLETVDFTQYDFVVLEVTTKDIDLTGKTALYNSLIGAMTSGIHVLYDGNIAPNGGSNGNLSDLDAVNVRALYEKCATSSDKPQKDWILITTRNGMQVYSEALMPGSVKKIADIINAGKFRNIDGNSGDSSNVYTVLEIEPCYPIDTVLATALNSAKSLQPITGHSFLEVADRGTFYGSQYKDSFYYLRTNGVLNTTDNEYTSDMISYGDNVPLTDLVEANDIAGIRDKITQQNINNVNDYYKWQLSKAKIAHATGKEYNDVRVVHMSSVEFATSRKSLLDNYDAIYIGGDHSAIKDDDYWYLKKLGCNYYTMYFHNGDIYKYDADLNLRYGADYGVLGGNDLTHDKLEELKTYASKMPIIFEKDLCDAYVGAKNNGTNQHLLDPESNMYKLMAAVTKYENSKLSGNYNTVVTNFDSSYTYKAINSNSKYGITYGGYATVFHGKGTPSDELGTAVTVDDNIVGEGELKDVLQKERPRLAMTYFPAYPNMYSEFEPQNWIDFADIRDDGLIWKVVVGSKATVNLYIDDDSNGKFDKTKELFATGQVRDPGKEVKLTFTPQNDYYGVVYWKIEAVTQDGLSSSKTGCCKIKRTYQSKMYVNLLNIMPIGENCVRRDTNGTNNTDYRNLYLCTECQYAKSILQGNRYTSLGIFYEGLMSGANTYYNGDPGCISRGTNAIENRLKASVNSNIVSNYTYKGTNLGWHTHDFGITSYNMTLGYDDALSNLFDIVRDDYDVDTTVVYADEFEDKVTAVKNYFAGMSDTQVENQITGTNGFEEHVNNNYKCYLAMKAIINGELDGDTIVTYNNGTATINYTKLASIDPNILDKLGTVFGTATAATKTQLETYAAASYKLDAIIESDLRPLTAGSGNGPDKAIFNGIDYWQGVLDTMTSSDLPRDQRKYYDLYNCYNATGRIPSSYNNAFPDWRDAKIYENFFFEQYQNNKWYASYDATKGVVDLDNIYDCICVGAADDFYYDDINEDGCAALDRYIAKDGNLILFHDALNSKQGATPVMSEKLSAPFGMNARHMVARADENNKTIKLYFADSTNEMENSGKTFYVEVPCSYASVTISYQDTNWGEYNPVPTITAHTDSASNASHNITVTLNGNKEQVIGVNTPRNYLNNGTPYGQNASFTVSSDLGVAATVMDFDDYAKSISNYQDIYYISDLGKNLKVTPTMLTMKGKYIKYDTGHWGNASENQYLMYKYACFYQKAEETSNNQALIGAISMMDTVRAGGRAINMPTDRAEQNNVGIITMYPFSIPSELHISVTSPVSYAVDIENPDIVVYYSLAGGTVGTSSSLFAADPMDGLNNYFLYQYNNITYTGAGHARITGYGRENNDERKLFINCILNAGKKSMRGPSVTLHDLNSTLDEVNNGRANKKVIPYSGEDCDYIIEIEDLDDFKGFDFLPHIPIGNTLDNVIVYYDVNHTDDLEDDGVCQPDTGTDIEIFKSSRDPSNNVDGGILKDMQNSTTANKVKLLTSCFDPKKNGSYAYIVVQVEDVHKQKSSAVLRIQFKESLIDLN